MIILLPVVIFSSFYTNARLFLLLIPLKILPPFSLLVFFHFSIMSSLTVCPSSPSSLSLSLPLLIYAFFFFFLAKHEKKEFDEMFKKLSTHTERESEMARGWCDRVEKGRTRGKKTIRKTENKC